MTRLIKIADIALLNQNTLNKSDRFDQIIYLDTGSITKNVISSTQKLNPNAEIIPSRAKRKVKNGTIIYSTVRPILEHYGILKDPPDNFIVSTGFTVIDIEDESVDPKFVFYLLTQQYVTNHLQSIAENSVSSYPSINPLDIANLQFEIPTSKAEQIRISNVLSVLDEKITNNKSVIEQLDGFVKTLFDYWFVQFDFPNEIGKPYKSSGGEMVNCEITKQNIPLNWKSEPLFKITNVCTQSISPESFPSKIFRHFSIPAYDANMSYIEEAGVHIGSNKFLVTDKDILVSKLNPWFNRVIYANSVKDSICSTEFVVWRTDSNAFKNFLYLIAKSDPFIKHCSQSATGTSNSHKRVNPDVMMRYSVPFNSHIVNLFGQKVEPMLNLIFLLHRENIDLENLRNWLQPLLMNSQISVH